MKDHRKGGACIRTRAAIYARFSSSRQREESIADQVRVCTERAMREGWDVGPVYADEARSGTDASRRPQFLRMVEDACKGRFDALLVYKLDRFARNRFDSATYKAKLRKAGVEVVSATEGVPDGPEGIILDSVLEGMSEYYSANLAQNVRRGMEGNAFKCRHNGVRVFGYECAGDGTYRVDEREADNLVDLAAHTRASSRIAARLDAIEDERPALEDEIAEMERGIPRIEPDMVRYMLWRIRQCDGPGAVVAGFVQRVVIDDDGGCLVTFNLYEKEKTQTPEGVWEISLGSPYQIRTGDLRLERAAS